MPLTKVTLPAPEALVRLKEGNARYVADLPEQGRSHRTRRLELREGQDPFAVVLTCSDSRVVPELIFDAGIGDLFVIRVAGNVAEDHEIGSIEYATVVLGTNLVVVMGHEGCGAVSATISGDETTPHIDELVRAIRPAVDAAREQEGDLLENAVELNARQVAAKLRGSPVVLGRLVRDRGLTVLSAVYHFSTGKVEWLDE